MINEQSSFRTASQRSEQTIREHQYLLSAAMDLMEQVLLHRE